MTTDRLTWFEEARYGMFIHWDFIPSSAAAELKARGFAKAPFGVIGLETALAATEFGMLG